MTPAEALALCRIAKGACPQQAFDEYTPDAWFALLEPYRFEDCRQALIDHVRSEPFVAPSEIISRVKKIRAKRIDDYGPFDPPAELAAMDYHQWLGDMRKRIADGDLTLANKPALTTGRGMPAIEGVFRTIPSDAA